MLASPALVLFLALFASQSGVLVLSPILSDVADDFGVSIATAGQLRIVAAPLAAVVALLAGRSLVRFSPRALLGAGSVLLPLGSVASAARALVRRARARPGTVVGGDLDAAHGRDRRDRRRGARRRAGRGSSRRCSGRAAGRVDRRDAADRRRRGGDWRLAFLVLPLPAALLAGLAAVATRRTIRRSPAKGRRCAASSGAAAPRRWALGELIATLGMGGHARLQRRAPHRGYGMTTPATGLALASSRLRTCSAPAGRPRSPDRAPPDGRCSRRASPPPPPSASPGRSRPASAVTLACSPSAGRWSRRGPCRRPSTGFPSPENLGPRGRRRARRHDAAWLPRRLARGWRGVRARRLPGARASPSAGSSRLDASVRSFRSGGRRRPARWPRRPALPASAAAGTRMPTRYVPLRERVGARVRPLRNGDVETVTAVFERLGEQSRRMRFNGPKPRLSHLELDHLATVDETRHVLVGYLAGHARPIAIARLVRDGSSAEIAFEVADEHQQRGIGSALTAELARGRARRGDHRGHGARREREHGRGLPAPASARTARRPVRGDGAIGARSARLSRPPVRRGASSRRAPR